MLSKISITDNLLIAENIKSYIFFCQENIFTKEWQYSVNIKFVKEATELTHKIKATNFNELITLTNQFIKTL